VRAAFRKLLDRPRVPLDPKAGESKTEGELVTERLSIASEKKRNGAVERVPMMIVMRPARAGGRRPAVIVLHGTGGSKDGAREHQTMVQLAGKGIIAVAIDARYHGERS